MRRWRGERGWWLRVVLMVLVSCGRDDVVVWGAGAGCVFLFFFNDTATTEIYTLSLHDALPIFVLVESLTLVDVDALNDVLVLVESLTLVDVDPLKDRKSTRLNSSHPSRSRMPSSA